MPFFYLEIIRSACRIRQTRIRSFYLSGESALLAFEGLPSHYTYAGIQQKHGGQSKNGKNFRRGQ